MSLLEGLRIIGNTGNQCRVRFVVGVSEKRAALHGIWAGWEKKEKP